MKTHPHITEKLLMERKESNQTNKDIIVFMTNGISENELNM